MLKAVALAVHGLVVAFFVRMARMGAYFSPREVRLVRMLRTDHIPWSVVERFILAPRGTARLVGYVELSDGSRFWMQGIGSWYRFARRSTGAEALVDEMNELLPAYRKARVD